MKKVSSICIALLFCMLNSCKKSNKQNIKNPKTEEKVESTKIFKTPPYNIDNETNGGSPDETYNYNIRFETDYKNEILDQIDLLKNKNFKFPNHKIFRDKIIEYFHINVDEYSEKNIVLYSDEVAMKSHSFVFSEIDPLAGTENPLSIYHLNNMVFYDDLNSTLWLISNDSYYVKQIFYNYGCSNNKHLLKFAVNNTDFSDAQAVQDLLLGAPRKMDNGQYKYVFRKKVEDFLVSYKGDEAFPFQINIIQRIIVRKAQGKEESVLHGDETIAYILKSACEAGSWGVAEYIWDVYPAWVNDILKANNYFNHDILKKYGDYGYEADKKRNDQKIVKWQKAVIDDPDGYTNIRDVIKIEKVLFKMEEGKQFLVDFSTVKNNAYVYINYHGTTGFIHKSRIKLLDQ